MNKNNRIHIKEILHRKFKREVILIGRVICLTKDSFVLSDETGEIEIYFERNECGFKVGDIVRTKVSYSKNNFFLKKLEVLTSCFKNPLDIKESAFYRLNLQNKKLLKILYDRQSFFQFTRDFFVKNGFLELHTPTLVESPGLEKHLEPFWTSYISYDFKEKLLFLPTSPEFSLKEALTAGIEKIFEISKCFRNIGENSILHLPEFFMLEWYRSYSSYEDIMNDCEEYLKFLSKKFKKKYIYFNGKKCLLNKIQRVRLKELFDVYKINLDDYIIDEERFINNIASLLKIQKKHIKENNLTKEDLFFKFFLTNIEPNLGIDYPTIIYEYPLEMTPLSKVVSDNPIYGKRFELYICGIELANGYEELTDPVEQKKRFAEIINFRTLNKKVPLHFPYRFLLALEQGLPPSSGIALGLERLFMLFEGINSIKECNLILSHSITDFTSFY